MTTNARDEKWSEWIDWSGGECPLERGEMCCVKYRNGEVRNNIPAGVNGGLVNAGGYDTTDAYWGNDLKSVDIIAYRYKIKEPESDMHPDLEWLARNVSEWPKFSDSQEVDYIYKFEDHQGKPHVGRHHPTDTMEGIEYTRAQWQAARQQLGLDHPEVTEAEEEAWKDKEREQLQSMATMTGPDNHQKYSAYYKDVRHIEYIDVYRTVDLFGCEKHGHPISHAAKKLLLSGSRTGGKDVEEDVREAIDTLHRWLEMREEDRRAV